MPKSVLLLRLMDLMREQPGLSISQLAAKLGRSERTIYRYLESLSNELHLQLCYVNGGYQLAERPVSSRLTLTPKEVLSVRLALTSGAIGKSGPFADYAISAWRRIESALTSDAVEDVESAVRKHRVYAPVCSPQSAGSETVECLADAVERSKRLNVLYLSQRSGETRSLEIDPYALVFRKHNWYLIAHSHSHKRTIQLKLARIVRASQTGHTFQLPHDFSIDSFYARGWETWTGGDEQLVRVKFSPRVARIIRESKRHPTQVLEDTPDGGVIMSITVAGIEEIASWILGWGASAEVLEPEELRESIRETASKLTGIYASGCPA